MLSIQQNLTFVSILYKISNTSIEFFPSFFVVNDLIILGHIFSKVINEWPQSSGTAFIPHCSLFRVKASSSSCHNHLGHLPSKILLQIVKSSSLLVLYSISSNFNYNPCHFNKSNKLSFGVSSLISRGPLDLVYYDICGPSSVFVVNGFKYYVIFVDHFTKYTWLYPLQLNLILCPLFLKFKSQC